MRRSRLMGGFALAGLLALALSLNASSASAHPGGGPPPDPDKLAVKHCQKELQVIGPQAFRAKYGPHAMRNCVLAARERVRHLIARADAACRDELAELGPEAFAEQYGVPGHPRVALRKCVFSKVREALALRREALQEAARECKAELEEIGLRAFALQYGAPGRPRVAFHRCVRIKLGDDAPVDEAPASP